MRRAALALAALALAGCGVTPYQRSLDMTRAALIDLNSPEMTARLCAAGADTPACRPKLAPTCFFCAPVAH